MRAVEVVLCIGLIAGAAWLGFYAGEQSSEAPRPQIPPQTPPQTAVARGFEAGSSVIPSGNPDQTLADVWNELDGFERSRQLVAVLSDRSLQDLASVRETIELRESELWGAEIGLILQWWVRLDPAGAMLWAEKMRVTTEPRLMGPVIAAWGAADFEAARDFLESRPKGAPIWFYASLVRGGTDGRHHAALQNLFMQLPDGTERQFLITEYAKRRTIREGSGATVAWAEAFPDEDARLKLTVYRRVAKALAEVDPVAARQWAEDVRFGPYGLNVLEMVARNEARGRDPSQTILWLSGLSEGSDLDAAYRDAFGPWFRTDAEAAEAWLRENANAPGLDRVRILYSTRLLESQGPEAAFVEVDRIQDEETRRSAIVSVVDTWWNKDPSAAEAWRSTADLDEELTSRILKRRASGTPQSDPRPSPQSPKATAVP